MIDLDELERIAKAATPGTWTWRDTNDLRTLHDTGKHRYGAQVLYVADDVDDVAMVSDDDAEYIGAASPATILALIAELRAYRDADSKRHEAPIPAPRGSIVP